MTINAALLKSKLHIENVCNRLGIRFTTPAHNGWRQADCPFHTSTSGKSLGIRLEGDGGYQCFGCEAHGDAIRLWQEMRGVDFPTACRELAEAFDLDPKSIGVGMGGPGDGSDLAQVQASLYAEIAATGKAMLNGSMDSGSHRGFVEDVRRYLTEVRSIPEGILAKTDICVLLPSEAIRSLLKLTHGSKADLIDDKKAFKLWGFTGDRCTVGFPYRDERGRVIGFIRRSTKKAGESFTDMNGQPVVGRRYDSFFMEGHGKNNPYGIHRIKPEAPEVLAVEGYVDAEVLSAYGVPTIAFGQGKYSKKYHESMMKKGIKRLILALDADKVGPNNTMDAIEDLLGDFDLSVVPGSAMREKACKDPEEFVGRHGIEEWRTLLRTKVIPWYQYVYARLATTLTGKDLLDAVLGYHIRIKDAYVASLSMEVICRLVGMKQPVFKEALKQRLKQDPFEPRVPIQPETPLFVFEERVEPIGYNGDKFTFYCPDTRQSLTYTLPQLEKNLAAMDSRKGYWEATYPHCMVPHQTLGQVLRRAAVVEELVRECKATGRNLSNTEEYGDGVYIHEGKVVVIIGKAATVDGVEVPLHKVPNRNLYLSTTEMRLSKDPATPEETKVLVAILNRLSFETAVDRFLTSGVLFSSYLSGCIPWRTHLWFTGEKGCGKSTLFDAILKPLLSPLNPVHLTGSISEAAFRQSIGIRAVPVLHDEAEMTDFIEKELNLIRNSSTGGLIGKGTVTGEAMTFRCLQTWFLGSISSSITMPQDKERILEINLKLVDSASWPETKRLIDGTISPEFGRRLFARAVKLVHTYHESFERCFDRFQEYFGKSWKGEGKVEVGRLARFANVFSNPICGHWHLTRDDVIPVEMVDKACEMLLASGRLASMIVGNESNASTHEHVWDQFLNTVIQVGSNPMTFRQALYRLRELSANIHPNEQEHIYAHGEGGEYHRIFDNLVTHGLYYNHRLKAVQLKSEHQGLRKIFEGLGFGDYKNVLKKLPTATLPKDAKSYKGERVRGVMVSLEEVHQEDEVFSVEARRNLLQ